MQLIVQIATLVFTLNGVVCQAHVCSCSGETAPTGGAIATQVSLSSAMRVRLRLALALVVPRLQELVAQAMVQPFVQIVAQVSL